MVKMLNVPDDKFNKLYEILEAVRSINELKVQLDMNGFNYDKKNELSFLVWVWSLVSSSSLSKPIAHYDDSWLKKNLSEEHDKDMLGEYVIVGMSSHFDYIHHRKYEKYFSLMSKDSFRNRVKHMVLRYAKDNINSIISVRQADSWMKAKLLGHHGKHSVLSEFKCTLLWYWLKANPSCKLCL